MGKVPKNINFVEKRNYVHLQGSWEISGRKGFARRNTTKRRTHCLQETKIYSLEFNVDIKRSISGVNHNSLVVFSF